MSKLGRRAALAAALALFAGTSTVCLRTVPEALRCVHPTRVRVTEAERVQAQAVLPSMQTVELHTGDGLRLQGWFSAGSADSAVALVHGLGSNRAQLLSEAAVLVRHGHGVLLFDSRANGDSEGEDSTWGDRERFDVVAALDFLSSRPDVDPTRIGLYGFSVGGPPVALVAAADPRVRAVALGPTWTSLRDELADKFPALKAKSAALAGWIFWSVGTDVDAVNPLAAIGRIAPRPLLLLSGSNDEDTPPAVMERLLTHAPGAVRWLVQGAGHGGYARVDAAGLDRRLGCFFDRALLPSHPKCA
jgi:dipeptidyl aminopeptidase/acylaminoacyl peptidase